MIGNGLKKEEYEIAKETPEQNAKLARLKKKPEEIMKENRELEEDIQKQIKKRFSRAKTS